MKGDFPILKGITYLDSAATTQKPIHVIDAISHYYKTSNANVHRGLYTLSQKATLAFEDARATVATFINTTPEHIVFTKGTTESLNLLASSLNLQEGDEIVLTEMEHHANLVPWQQTKATLKFIPLKDDYHLDLEAAKELITDKTKIVAVTHISNVLGTINDIETLTQLAHSKGAKIVVDAAQSIAHLTIDIKDIDFLAFSGHKMCGPTGIGILYGKDFSNLKPYQFGGDMIKEVTYETSTFQEAPYKFEAGTPNIAGAIGLAAAITYLETATHPHITEYALEKLQSIEGLKIIGPQINRAPVFSFTLEGIHPHDVAEILSKHNICVRAGHHCAMPLMKKLNIHGTTRASFYIYNTKEDVDTLVEGIKKVQEVFK
ncbi:cysteine desulfurase [Candidatus Woesearchaeota archaeon]|nr:cysteine desulfurase [Candidatus Woesearchaeota archaeon]